MPASARPGRSSRVEESAAGRSAPRPRRGSGCRTGPPATAAAASAGPARGRTPRGRRAAGAARSPTGCDGSGTAISAAAVGPGLGEQPLDLGVPVGDPGRLDHVEPLVRRRRGRPRATSRGRLEPQRAPRAPMPVARPRPGRVVAGVGVGGALGRLVEPRRPPARPSSSSRSRDDCLVGRGAERRRPRAPEVRRDAQPVRGAGERDVAQPELLLGVVLRGCRRGRRRARPCRSPRAAAGRARRRAAGPAAPTGEDVHRVRDRLDGKRVSHTPTRKTECPLQALGPVHGEQLDRVGLASGSRRRGRCPGRPRR